MVRLKDGAATRKIRQQNHFQFQHGTIKSNDTYEESETGMCFQFQHGTIKRLPDTGIFFPLTTFQFQHGTIKS